MSLAEDEAGRVYPTRYRDGTHVKEKFHCDTDDLQEAYPRDRRHISRHPPLLRVPAGGREANRNGRPDMATLDPVLFRRLTNGKMWP